MGQVYGKRVIIVIEQTVERGGVWMSVFMGRFFGQKGIVTGGASGIGLAIVERLLSEGASVVVADLNEESMQQIANHYKGAVLTVRTDVTQEAEVEALVAKAVEHYGQLDFAFNVAGAAKSGVITDLAESDWDFTVDLCLKGVFLCVKHQARYMKEHGGGAIVNIASLNAHVPMYGGAAYSSAKAGVEMLTKNAALELARHNIRVNAVLPGLVDTPLTTGLTAAQPILDAFKERIPMERAAEAREIAGPAVYLASHDAGYITGASLLVDGGWATSGYPDLSKFI